MSKRLLGAIVDGLGNAAGHALWDGLKKQVAEALTEEENGEKEQQQKADEAKAAPPLPSAKELEKQRLKAAKEAERAAADKARKLDAELAELKRRMGR
jgi:hypothetical protein